MSRLVLRGCISVAAQLPIKAKPLGVATKVFDDRREYGSLLVHSQWRMKLGLGCFCEVAAQWLQDAAETDKLSWYSLTGEESKLVGEAR
jgi:hypothetical protein